jgi:hypothetical protein
MPRTAHGVATAGMQSANPAEEHAAIVADAGS